MAISDNYQPDSSPGNGVTTVFTGNWSPLTAAAMLVETVNDTTGVRTEEQLGVDYTLTFNNSGYSVTMTTAPVAGTTLVRSRVVPLTQENPFRTLDGFDGLVEEQSFDKLTAITQDLQNQVDRSLKFPTESTNFNITVPDPVANTVLGWNATADGLINGPTFDDIENAEGFANDAEASASASAASAAQSALSAESLSGTSATERTIGTGAVSFVTQANKRFEAGRFLLITDSATPANYMYGQVTAYSGTALTVNVTETGGSGTIDSWNIFVSGVIGPEGPQGPAGSGLGTPRTQILVGDGATATYGLGFSPSSTEALEVILAGASQIPGASYAFTVSGSDITFAENLPDGEVAFCRYIDGGIPTLADTGVAAGTYPGVTSVEYNSKGQVLSATLVREILTAPRTYYVATTGSNSNDGLTPGAPFLTLQKAIDTLYTLDINGQSVLIDVADGTYTAGFVMNGPLVGLKDPQGGLGAAVDQVRIVGNTGTPQNCLINVPSGNSCVNVRDGASIGIAGMGYSASASGSKGVVAFNGGRVYLYDAQWFGSIANGVHLEAGQKGMILFADNSTGYTIDGGAGIHMYTYYDGYIRCINMSNSINSVAFTTSFANALGGTIYSFGSTWSGSATGQRYSVSRNGLIDTSGGGATYFPGNSAGVVTTGGQYV